MNKATTKAVKNAARASAAQFYDEFPGETLEGDWDSEAFAIDSSGKDWPSEAWEVYRAELRTHLALLNGD